MSKVLFAMLVLLVCTMADPLQDIKAVIQQDQCGMEAMEKIKPELEKQAALLRENPENMEAKTELIALIEKSQQIYNNCGIQNKVEPMLGDAVKATGIAFLLASNCFKDVGAVLLIADTIIQDPKDWQNDIVVLIFVALMGRQGYADCSQFIHFVI